MDIFYTVILIVCAIFVVVNGLGVVRAQTTGGAVASVVGVVFGAIGVALALAHFGVFS